MRWDFVNRDRATVITVVREVEHIMALDRIDQSATAAAGDADVIPVAVDTVCRALHTLLMHARRDGDHRRYDDAIVQLANIAMAVTTTFDPYVLALNECLTNRDYAGAVLIGRAMIDHETVLIEAESGNTVRPAGHLQ